MGFKNLLKFYHFKIIIYLVVIFFFFNPLIVSSADIFEEDIPGANENSIMSKLQTWAGYTGYTETENKFKLASAIGIFVNTLLGLLGLVFILIIIYAGFTWMTAGGNEEKIKKVRGLIFNAFIGLVITLSAYIITWIVSTQLIQ